MDALHVLLPLVDALLQLGKAAARHVRPLAAQPLARHSEQGRDCNKTTNYTTVWTKAQTLSLSLGA